MSNSQKSSDLTFVIVVAVLVLAFLFGAALLTPIVLSGSHPAATRIIGSRRRV
jgi:hypothetical protein